MAMVETLRDMAQRHGTDKYDHGYCPYYERHLGGLRNWPIRLLEIGIYHGESLRMWQEYFTKASIIGVDIDPNSMFNGERVASILGDIKTVELDGNFDVIIDDGSHFGEDIVAASDRLWSKLNPGGWYIIEDWLVQWNHPNWHSDSNGSEATRMLDALIHEVIAEDPSDIDEMHVYRQILFIRKKQ